MTDDLIQLSSRIFETCRARIQSLQKSSNTPINTLYECLSIGAVSALSSAQRQQYLQSILTHGTQYLQTLTTTHSPSSLFLLHFLTNIIDTIESQDFSIDSHSYSPESVLSELFLPILMDPALEALHSTAVSSILHSVHHSRSFDTDLPHNLIRIIIRMAFEKIKNCDRMQKKQAKDLLRGPVILIVELYTVCVRESSSDESLDAINELLISLLRGSQSAIQEELGIVRILLLPVIFAILPLRTPNHQEMLISFVFSYALTAYQTIQDSARKNSLTDQEIADSADFSVFLSIVYCLLPCNPDLLFNEPIIESISVALLSENTLVRKQALAIFQSIYDTNSAQIASNDEKQLWNHFLIAAQLIHSHGEQHLIDQIWPQVTQILKQNFISRKIPTQNDPIPLKLSFRYIRTLFSRVFAHANPIVRRRYITNFMEICIYQMDMQFVSYDSLSLNMFHRSQFSASCVSEAGFLYDATFAPFVMEQLIVFLNDSQLLKAAEESTISNCITDFYAKYLSIACRTKRAGLGKIPSLCVFVRSIRKAFFGDRVRHHAPEALVSLLRVFEQKQLQDAVKDAEMELLDSEALNSLRFMLQEHVLTSFPAETQGKILRSVQCAMTQGFMQPAHSLKLCTLAKTLALYPIGLLLRSDQRQKSMFTCFHAFLRGSSDRFRYSVCWESDQYIRSKRQEQQLRVLRVQDLARLHLFTVAKSAGIESGPAMIINQPLIAPVSEALYADMNVRTAILELYAAWEEEMKGVLSVYEHAESSDAFVAIQVDPIAVYAFMETSDKDNCVRVFQAALELLHSELDRAVLVRDVKHFTWLPKLAVQLAIHVLKSQNQLAPFTQLDQLCLRIYQTLTSNQSCDFQIFALETLSSISSARPYASECLSIFQTSHPFFSALLNLQRTTHDKSFTKMTNAQASTRFIACQWQIMADILHSALFIPLQTSQSIVSLALSALESINAGVLQNVVYVLSFCLHIHRQAPEPLQSAIWNAYVGCQHRFEALTDAVVHCLLLTNVTFKLYFACLFKFGERRPLVMRFLAHRACLRWKSDSALLMDCVHDIRDLLLYRETILQIGQDTAEAHVLATVVRFHVLAFLEHLAPENAITEPLVTLLLQPYEMVPQWSEPQMKHNAVFGAQLRTWQALCVLAKHNFSNTLFRRVQALVYKRILLLPQHSAIRYYIEIFAMQLLPRMDTDRTVNTLIVPLLMDSNLNPYSSSSLMLIVSHFLATQAIHMTRIHLNTLMMNILPRLSASHGHVRVVALFCIREFLPSILAQAESDEYQIQFLTQVIQFLSENKECKRMFARQRTQLEQICPEIACTVRGILHSSRLELHELVPNEEKVSWTLQLQKNMQRVLAQFQKEHMQIFPEKEMEACAVETKDAALQRKIEIFCNSPFETLAVRDEMRLNARQIPRQRVIMCASLVKKVTNLAGLARTCEILNAEKLVIANRCVMKDTMFVSMSKSAHQWVPVQETPSGSALVAFLQFYKSQRGYSIVAVEQTSRSVSCSSYPFPEKAIIVLGNEKEGIPVDILSIADVCVEIPQFGLVRSLNVHVSGAILLWEYTKQWSLSLE